MGAYYTDQEHCKWISNFLEFPDDEVAALEPSIGDGSAIKAVTGGRESVKIFGVELDKEVAESLKGKICEVLNADFTCDVRISNSVFSFCFANPPYQKDEDSKQRVENIFFDKCTTYLKTGGIFVLVIPHSVFINNGFYKRWISRYETKFVYKFHEKEFEKYKQIVLIGEKRKSVGCLASKAKEVADKVISLDNIEKLPESYDGEKVKVIASNEKDVTVFTKIKFDPEETLKKVRNIPDIDMEYSELVSMPQIANKKLLTPPIPLKKDSLHLCIVAGAGSGFAGSEETEDLHLQRGTSKVIEELSTRLDEKGKSVIVETSYTKSLMTIVESDGTISVKE